MPPRLQARVREDGAHEARQTLHLRCTRVHFTQPILSGAAVGEKTKFLDPHDTWLFPFHQIATTMRLEFTTAMESKGQPPYCISAQLLSCVCGTSEPSPVASTALIAR